MKSLSACFESLLDDEDVFYGSNSDKKIIEGWIYNNYSVTGKLTISDDFVVNCAGHIVIKNKSITTLTNGLFRWAKIGGDFYCSSCKKLKSLEGAPEKVGGSFDCANCKNKFIKDDIRSISNVEGRIFV